MAAQSPQSNQNDNSLDFLWLIVIIVAVIALTWYFGKDYITAGFYQVRFYEIMVINFIISGWNYLAAVLHLPVVDNSNLITWAEKIRTHTLDSEFTTLQQVSSDVGRYFSYPFAAVLMILAFFVYTKNISLKFKNIFTMKRLRSLEQKDWPQITPVVNLDLVKQDLNEGPWAMSMTPMQFCKKYDLLKEEKKDGKITATLKRGAAHNIFVLQLGSLWTSVDALPIHVKALFAIFIAAAEQDRDSANKLLLQIAASANSGKLNFAGVEQLLAKHRNSKLAARVIQSHAYVSTVMPSMIELARTDGVLATADFLWLKPVDRKLWYILNSVGRQTAVAEVGGPFAHWIAERKLGRALQVPMVEEAVIGLEAAFNDIIYEADEV